MPRHRHPSVPNAIGWILLGRVTTDTGALAIVGPEMAGLFGDQWTARWLDEHGELLQTPHPDELSEGEIPVGVDGDLAVLASVFADGTYIVEGRMADAGDGAELCEIRIRLWICECTCHGEEDPAGHLCEGDCHDQDPAHDGDGG
jgi:hypothetical protein